jgi:hypothetical protein
MKMSEKIKRIVGVILCGIPVMINTIVISGPATSESAMFMTKQKTAISCRPVHTDRKYKIKLVKAASPFHKNDQGGCAHPGIAAFAYAFVRLKRLYAKRNSCVH